MVKAKARPGRRRRSRTEEDRNALLHRHRFSAPTTTKAVVIDEQQNILGRGITNSRSNYDTAAAIAKQEGAGSTTASNLVREALAAPAR